MSAQNSTQFGLGIDAGGTATRWVLISKSQTTNQHQLINEGVACGLTGLLMATLSGQAQLTNALQSIMHGACGGQVAVKNHIQVFAGFTGLPDDSNPMQALCSAALDLAPSKLNLVSDIELTHRAHFLPGEGYIVYAGTGSYASFIDDHGTLHRRGAHGGVLDDGGSGFWIAREALKQVWRREDEQAGLWHQSPMAKALFEQLGGSDWANTRHFVYGQSNAQMRGQMGILARAVGATAQIDPIAKSILTEAGYELARLANILCAQFGSRPMQLAGRVFNLHPIVFETARETIAKVSSHSIQLSGVPSLATFAASIAVNQTF